MKTYTMKIETADDGSSIVRTMERLKETLKRNKITADVHFSREYAV